MNEIKLLHEMIGEERRNSPNGYRLANKYAAGWLKAKFEVKEKLDLASSRNWHRAALKKRC
ncbi:MAG: hypothetical protein ACK4JD_12770 [Thermoflexales bacterium]